MIIDWILDRRDLEEQLKSRGKKLSSYVEWYNDLSEQDKNFAAKPYNAHDFYIYALKRGYRDVTLAMDYGTEEAVKKVLCEYVTEGRYSPQICDYINSVKWVGEEE